MIGLHREPERLLYEGSYLAGRRLRIKYADRLSKFFAIVGYGDAFESAAGIMQRLGQQWLARDYLETLDKSRGPRDSVRSQYHFDSFIILTKSNFDFIAHLVNQVLKLGFRGNYVDLARPEFRKEIAHQSPQLGDIINRQSSMIVEISKYRKAIEHQKTIPLTYVDPKRWATISRGKWLAPVQEPPVRFPTLPISFTESLKMIALTRGKQKGTKKYRTRQVVPYCDWALKKTQQIVEKTFEVACDQLHSSETITKFVRKRLGAETLDLERLRNLNAINENTMTQYLQWKFPEREPGISAGSTIFSALLSELREVGIRNYDELDRAIEANLELFDNYENASWPPLMVPINWYQQNPPTKKPMFHGLVVVQYIVREIRSKR